VVADNVTIDLCGFSMIGDLSSRDAIHSDGGPFLTGLFVRNGSILRWGTGSGVYAGSVAQVNIENLAISNVIFEGVWIGAQSQIQHCKVTAARNGLRAGAGSLIADCTVKTTSERGIDAGAGCIVRNCSVANATLVGIATAENSIIQGCAVSNSVGGFNVGFSCALSNCSAYNNNGNGINTGGSCTVTNCSALSNIAAGIKVGPGCTVTNSLANSNTMEGISAQNSTILQGCTVYANTGDGIFVLSDSIVRACNVGSNLQDGIDSGDRGQIIDNLCDSNGFAPGTQSNIYIVGGSSRIEGNSIVGGDRGITTAGDGNVIVRNSVRGGTNPYGGIAGGNDVGPIGTAATSTSPWANIQY
jgi:hypothetical protein